MNIIDLIDLLFGMNLKQKNNEREMMLEQVENELGVVTC